MFQTFVSIVVLVISKVFYSHFKSKERKGQVLSLKSSFHFLYTCILWIQCTKNKCVLTQFRNLTKNYARYFSWTCWRLFKFDILKKCVSNIWYLCTGTGSVSKSRTRWKLVIVHCIFLNNKFPGLLITIPYRTTLVSVILCIIIVYPNNFVIGDRTHLGLLFPVWKCHAVIVIWRNITGSLILIPFGNVG